MAGMKAAFLVLGSALALAASWQAVAVVAAGRTKIYRNVRFGYQVSYPADLLEPEPEADNGDGRAFHARHGSGKVLVWGSYRLEDVEPTPSAIAHGYEKDCGRGSLSYEVIKPRLIAFSCRNAKGEIIYQKTLVGRDILRSVRVEYPETGQAVWDAVTKQMSASFRALP